MTINNSAFQAVAANGDCVRVLVCEAEVEFDYTRAKAPNQNDARFTGLKPGASTVIPASAAAAAANGATVQLFEFAAAASKNDDEKRKRRDAVDALNRKEPKLPKNASKLAKGSWGRASFRAGRWR